MICYESYKQSGWNLTCYLKYDIQLELIASSSTPSSIPRRVSRERSDSCAPLAGLLMLCFADGRLLEGWPEGERCRFFDRPLILSDGLGCCTLYLVPAISHRFSIGKVQSPDNSVFD